jgi:hypothetical protein
MAVRTIFMQATIDKIRATIPGLKKDIEEGAETIATATGVGVGVAAAIASIGKRAIKAIRSFI